MGCSSSKVSHERDENRVPRPAPGPVTLPEVVWATLKPWRDSLEKSTNPGEKAEDTSEAAQFQRAREWLAHEFPECHRSGMMEEIGQNIVRYGACRYHGKDFVFLDGNHTGVVVATTLVLGLPAKQGQDGARTVAMFESPEMEAAKKTLLTTMARMEQLDVEMTHAVAQVVSGDHMVQCKFKLRYQEPTVRPVPEGVTAEINALNAKMCKMIKKDKSAEVVRGIFVQANFRIAVEFLKGAHGGCTVLDGGKLPFKVDGKPYPEPARLLVVRQFVDSESEKEVEATLYKVLAHKTEASDQSVTFLGGKQSDETWNGVVHVEIIS
ncbi:hypothetical protein BKA67DRAFT_697228 [Truncatella angustata]|uniref:Uncharacterized protein n=1 Tax=Truncatella angustata TaxID=152316 RepID=A0A9P8REZ7_9PEZI|nr:uncharacterized protein BKA67DRAFT_697228 [Truncatella angustata]KAH6640064.1 hypothetical protein BKA67DRAFT_697228 [Truncatella angustata]KAH8195744.1 hypothetical protein TruAng_010098 [Truncatella angustata]